MPRKKLTNEEKQKRNLLGCRIKAARLSAGYPTMNSFITRFFPKEFMSMILQWETGKRIPDDETLKKISEYCEVNYQWLKTGEGNMLEGINIPTDKARKKKAIAGIELLIKDFSESYKKKDIANSGLEKILANYTEQRKLCLSDTNNSIQEELLSAIIEEVCHEFKKHSMNINPKQLATFSIKLYNIITKTVPERELQLKMIKPLILSMEDSFKLEAKSDAN